MKIVYLTSGAAGMYCGSCMHDNALAKALSRQGVDVELVPTYTPIRTDEHDISVDQVFFGGINVYLQQKIPLLRFIPKIFDRILDSPWLIKRVTRNASTVSPMELGKLAVSMLKGEKGNQKKEVKRLCNWLANHSKPDVVVFSNVLIGGCIPTIRKKLDAKCVVTLQGDDIFLESLPDKYRRQCIEEITKVIPFVDKFISHSQFYADYMSEMLTIPSEKITVTPLGIDIDDMVPDQAKSSHDPTIGFLARLAPEKGLGVIVDAFIQLKKSNRVPNARLKIAGWLGASNQEFVDQQFQKLADHNLGADFEYVGSIDREEKIRFLQSIDVLSVPTIYKEPKGLFVLEALALGVPVVQPNHGAFPEVIADTGGGILFEPNDSKQLAKALTDLLTDSEKRRQYGERGRESVRSSRNSESMATATLAVLKNL